MLLVRRFRTLRSCTSPANRPGRIERAYPRHPHAPLFTNRLPCPESNTRGISASARFCLLPPVGAQRKKSRPSASTRHVNCGEPRGSLTALVRLDRSAPSASYILFTCLAHGCVCSASTHAPRSAGSQHPATATQACRTASPTRQTVSVARGKDTKSAVVRTRRAGALTAGILLTVPSVPRFQLSVCQVLP